MGALPHFVGPEPVAGVLPSRPAPGACAHVNARTPARQRVDSLWNGDATCRGQNVMVHNAGHNGSLTPGQSATFGYVVSGSGGDSTTGLLCRVG